MSEQNTQKTHSGGDVSEKIFNTRIVHKHDTEANWNKAVNFIPKAGELIVYDTDENYNYTRTKVGDGISNINALPFSHQAAVIASTEAPEDTTAVWVDLDDNSFGSSEILLDLYGQEQQTVIFNTTWSKGGYNSSGAVSSNTSRIHSEFIVDKQITLITANGYSFGLYAWDSDGVYLGRLTYSGAFATAGSGANNIVWNTYLDMSTMPGEYTYRIVLRHDDDTAIDVSEGVNVFVITVMSNNGIYGDIEYLKTYVTPQMFGAKADGITDDTIAINRAAKSLKNGGTLYFPPGTYLVRSPVSQVGAISFNNKSGITVHLDNAATVKHAFIDEFDRYEIFRFNDCNGVEFFGGTVMGDLDDGHVKVNEGPGAYAIKAARTNNIYIHDTHLTSIFGDGISIGPSASNVPQIEGVLIENCTISHTYRNGMVLDGTKNAIVRNCCIHDVHGNMPMAGIDLECHWGIQNTGVLIDNCHIYDCGKLSVAVSAGTRETVIKNCNFETHLSCAAGSDLTEIKNTIVNGRIAARNRVIISDCVMKILLVNNDDSVEDVQTELKMYRSTITGESNCCVHFTTEKEGYLTSSYFEDCTFNTTDSIIHGVLYIISNTTKDISFERCAFNLKNIPCSTVNTGSGVEGDFKVNNCTFYAEDTILNHQLFDMPAKGTIKFTNNVVDLSNLTSYIADKSIIGLKSGTAETNNAFAVILNNKIITKKTDEPLFSYIFGVANVYGDVYIVGNVAPNCSTLHGNVNGSIFARNNILSNNSVDMVVTYEDGSTRTLKVVID